MTIEFRCPECGKLLRTTDDKAGMGANCPGCGTPIQVPSLESSPAEREPDEFDLGEAVEYEREAEGYAGPAGPPLGEEAMKTCPMCGEQIKAAAVKCRYCGENLGAPEGVPTRIEPGAVISKSWEIFNAQMGLCIGGVILANFISGLVGAPANVVDAMREQGAIGQDAELIAVLVSGVFTLLSWLVQLYMQLGVNRLLLHVARGQPAEIGDLFKGGPYYLRMLGSSILFGLAVGVGLLLCVVPGIIVALMFWPYALVLVDKNPPGVDCLSRAKTITDNNWGAIFLLALATFGINILGALACCVGLIFTIPLTTVMFVVAYCGMTGQRTIAG